MAFVYIVEDDKNIREIEVIALKNSGYEVQEFETAGEFRKAFEERQPDLLLLDLMLPDADGLDIVRELRQDKRGRELPIILVTARTTEIDKVKGLDIGADDYLTKPFNPLELIARIRSNIRRYYSLGSQAEAEAKESRQIRVGDLVLDEDSVTLKKGDQVITITPTEYKMLSLFMKSPGKVFTKMQIYQAVNGECYVNDDNTLMVHISNLRDKIEDNPREPKYIKNIRGIGYKIEKL